MVSREELYELVWSKPMMKVAEQFDVSSSYLARICANLKVPRPERGYWAKLAVGRAPERPPLPEAQAGDQLSWSQDGVPLPPPKPQPPARHQRAVSIPLPKNVFHGLISGAKHHYETGRPVEDGAYLKPYKKLLVDVTASKAGLDKALRFANDLFNAFESVGHRVMLAPPGEQLRRSEVDEHEVHKERREYSYPHLWSPARPTVVYIGTVAIGLAIIEMSEKVLMRYVDGKYIRDADYKPPKYSRYYTDRTWTTTRDIPSGRLRLVAYSPYWRASWSQEWQETKEKFLEAGLAGIITSIENSAPALVEKIEEANRLAEIERQKWEAEQERYRREEDRRRVQQSVRDSREQLGQIIQKWSHVISVERFLTGVEEHISNLPAPEQDKVLQRLRLAREFLGTQDPLEFFLSWKTPLERYAPVYNMADEDSEGQGSRDDVID